MLKIEIVRFEAQDVITTSVAAPAIRPASGKDCYCTGHCKRISPEEVYHDVQGGCGCEKFDYEIHERIDN